jgi:type II secretory ATPase GspE/PulE/Tfp pilus assembly ATPase PilB-like protein
MSLGSNKLHLKEYLEIQNGMKPGESLIRTLQHKRLVNAREVVAMRKKMEYMNSENDTDAFSKRLQRIVSASLLDKDEVNIRFRGQGCKHCFQGHSGVAPASEVLVPDDEFLQLIRNGDADKAELYWKTTLHGRSATSDTYDKIFSGVVDPRTVEEELENLGR